MERVRITITAMTVMTDETVKVELHRVGDGAMTRMWKTWASKEAVGVLLRVPKSFWRAGGVAVPASAVFGSDQIHEVEIGWEEEFERKEELLTAWVMVT